MFGLEQDKNVEEFITDEILKVFKTELVTLLVEILDTGKAFEEVV